MVFAYTCVHVAESGTCKFMGMLPAISDSSSAAPAIGLSFSGEDPFLVQTRTNNSTPKQTRQA
jgi:hypothetical protein